MPTRLIREGILTSERVASLSWEAEVFYRRLLSLVDDYGLSDARPSVLRSALYPLQLEKMSECNVQRCLAACETAGLILLFARNGKSFLMVRDFGQSLRSAPKYPLPDGYKAIQVSKSKYQLVAPDDDCTQLQTDENSCSQLCTYANAYSDANAKTDKQENNVGENNTVVCSNPPWEESPAAPVLPAPSFPDRERLNDVRGMRCADNHADLGASPGAARFVAATLEINPSWSRTLPTALEQAAALEAYQSAQGRVTPRDMEMLRAYYASGLTHDRSNKAFWRPDSRRKFWECFGDVLTHADRWAKETRWKSASARKMQKPKPEPQQPEGPVVDTDTAAAEIRELRKEMGLGGSEE
ncbi:MAG: hypothetical protein KHX31_08670 [Akkermansia sp.]|uniref:hypothetical protein n=1 Tax=Akkermansia sp. TaxID=1872421 RepID=UPI0025B93F75|nr:hypothetical protein [Akkermansia sp.]MBS5508695.1 hypothetical protein [Akkermansia sp.]